MGFYIDPKDQTKEDFLRKHGIVCRNIIPTNNAALISNNAGELPEAYVIVCLMDNGDFTAAGIAYNQDELAAFKNPDGRPKQFWIVELRHLRPYLHGQEVSCLNEEGGRINVA